MNGPQDEVNSEIVGFAAYLFNSWISDFSKEKSIQIKDGKLPVDYFFERMLKVGLATKESFNRILGVMQEYTD